MIPTTRSWGAANYLHASGAPENDRLALYHYNPVPEYVDAVMRYARQMSRTTTGRSSY